MHSRRLEDSFSRSWLNAGEASTSKLVYILPLCCWLLAGGLGGCAKLTPLSTNGVTLSNPFQVNVTPIGEIKQNPNVAASVYLRGQVVQLAPFVGSAAYQLQDTDENSIWVITNHSSPKVGDEVLIEGQVQFQSIPIAGQDLGEVYILEQQQLEVKAGQSESPTPLPTSQ